MNKVIVLFIFFFVSCANVLAEQKNLVYDLWKPYSKTAWQSGELRITPEFIESSKGYKFKYEVISKSENELLIKPTITGKCQGYGCWSIARYKVVKNSYNEKYKLEISGFSTIDNVPNNPWGIDYFILHR